MKQVLNIISNCTHPGVALQNELSVRGISQKDLAVSMGKSTTIINDIIKGKRDINAEIAVLLESLLPNGELDAKGWLNLQAEYDIAMAKANRNLSKRTELIKTWNTLQEVVNLKALKKRLNFGGDIEKNISILYSCFGVADLQELKTKAIMHTGHFKKSEKLHTDSANLLSWIAIVNFLDKQAGALKTSFSKKNMSLLKEELNNIFLSNSNTEDRVKNLLNRYGIKFIQEEKLEQTPVDGYVFWRGKNPTIAVTKRINRLDNYAFTIMHELGHLTLHLRPNCEETFIDADSATQNITDQETAANNYATEALWKGSKPDDVFQDVNNPYSYGGKLMDISQNLKINLGIVTGQFQHFCLQHKKTKNPYTLFRNLLEEVK